MLGVFEGETDAAARELEEIVQYAGILRGGGEFGAGPRGGTEGIRGVFREGGEPAEGSVEIDRDCEAEYFAEYFEEEVYGLVFERVLRVNCLLERSLWAFCIF